MNLEEFVMSTYKSETYYHRPRIVCVDGFSISLQGGDGMYSSPRENAMSYSEMEGGFPSEEDAKITPYAEDGERPTETVYPYVPMTVWESVIRGHGGIDVEKTFESKKH
jgi:hypothetical protein